ncbi:HD domain-containing protein [Candidatus Saccharibacteria bacterium]|nr:HD domain-containing protein [Candidatus Saccharibacteria bacterium]
MKEVINYREYRRILGEEFRLRPNNKFHQSFLSSSFVAPATDIRYAVEQIREIALNSTVLRSYVQAYGMDLHARAKVPAQDYNGANTTRSLAYESDGAHANLLCEILDHALIACYGPDFGEPGGDHPYTIDGYTYREIMKTARAHDLTENITGDNPDNGGSYDKAVKDAFEHDYVRRILSSVPHYNAPQSDKSAKLFCEMQDRSTPTGRLLYVCDKFAANVMVLTYDSLGFPPMLHYGAPRPLSNRDKEEMELCDFVDDMGRHLASEMWAVDMLHIRNIVQYDDTGFITACLVMYTLMIHGHWYAWREHDYEAAKP